MSCESRSEYLSVQNRRYRRAGKLYKTLWLRSGLMCGKRLKEALPHWLGYDRLVNPAILKELNALYLDWEKLNDFFKPSLRLVSKVRIKSRHQKKYDTPQAPCERLKASGILSKERVAGLQRDYESLDPFKLDKRIQRRFRKIEKMKRTGGSAAVGEPGLPDGLPPWTTLKPTGT